MPPKSAAASSAPSASAGSVTSRKSRDGPAPSALPPQIPEVPISWEDSFVHGHSVDPAVTLPLEPYDEAAQLAAPRGTELHALLEEEAAQSKAYTKEMARLQAELSRHTRDTTEMVKYLEAEVRRKDLMGKRLTRQLSDLRSTHESELALMQKHFENTGKYMEKIFMDKERQMLALNAKLEAQIADMSSLSSLRTALSSELESTKQLIFSNERAHKLQLDTLEKKFLAAREGLQREAAQRIAQSRANYKEEVGAELEAESREVRERNEALRHDLKVHESTSDRLQREHAHLTARIYSSKQDLELRTQQNEEYARKAQRQTRQIDRLTRETGEMEAQLVAAMREAEEARARAAEAHSAQVEPLQSALDAARGEAAQLDARNKSLRNQARRALRERKELEAFFLKAIQETRDTIRRRDDIQKKERALLQAAQLRELTLPPALRTKLPPIQGLDTSESVGARGSGSVYAPALSLSDLTLSERDKVLRLLYAKMTHVPSGITVTLPPHSFATDITEATQQRPQTIPQHALPPVVPMLALHDLRAPAAAPTESPVPQLPAADAEAAAAEAAAPAELAGASYDSTFLTNFNADDDDDDSDDGDGDGDTYAAAGYDHEDAREDPHNVD